MLSAMTEILMGLPYLWADDRLRLWANLIMAIQRVFYKYIIFKYNQQDATLHELFISVKCSTCFRRFLRQSSEAQKLYMQHRVLCQTFSATCHCRGRDVLSLQRQWQVAVKFWESTRCCIYSFWAPDDGRRNRLKHVEHFTEINKLCNVASCCLYLKMHLRCMDPWKSEVLSKFGFFLK